MNALELMRCQLEGCGPATPPFTDGRVDLAALVRGEALPQRRVVELAGSAGSGKTSACLAAAAHAAALPGAAVAYVYSTAIAPSPGVKLRALALARLEAAWAASDGSGSLTRCCDVFPHTAAATREHIVEDDLGGPEEAAALSADERAALAAGLDAARVEAVLRSFGGGEAGGAGASGSQLSDATGVDPAALRALLDSEAHHILDRVLLFQVFDAWAAVGLLREVERALDNAAGWPSPPQTALPPLPVGGGSSIGAGSTSDDGGDDVEMATAGARPRSAAASAAGGDGGGGDNGDASADDSDDAYAPPPPPPGERHASRPAGAAFAQPPVASADAPRVLGLPPDPRCLRLLVIDSLGGLIGPVLGSGPRVHAGHALMAETGRVLARLTRTHGLTVLVTNTLVVDRGEGGGGDTGGPRVSRTALGPSWRYIPDVTVILERGAGGGDGGGGGSTSATGAAVVTAVLAKHSDGPWPATAASTVAGTCDRA